MKEGIRMKKLLKVLISIIVVLALIFAGGMFYISNGLKAGADVKMNGLKLTNVKDGTYSGKYKAGRFSNEIEVTVSDKKITDIKVKKDVMFAKPEVTSGLFTKVIMSQDTKVDTVSGATVTSKAYLKSIENAFNN